MAARGQARQRATRGVVGVALALLGIGSGMDDAAEAGLGDIAGLAHRIGLARGALRRERPERAAELWRALVSGHRSVVESVESHGTRYLLALHSARGAADPRQLTQRERDVLELAAAGHSNNAVSLELGLSPARVSRLLHAGMGKLGIRARAELAAYVTSEGPRGLEALSFTEADEAGPVVLAVPLPEWELPAALTRAEREVARALLSGRCLAAIAEQRGTSMRTVANQVRAVYQKVGVSSLGELASRCVRSAIATRED